MSIKPLSDSFYLQDDVVALAQACLGKLFVTTIDGVTTSGIIIETEAYCHKNDRACHAYKKKTLRNEVMFGAGGHLYAYLCYGIHTLINVVTNVEGKADAVLIRGILPFAGEAVMVERRGVKAGKSLTDGPGKVSQALGLTRAHNKLKLDGDIRLEDLGLRLTEGDFQRLKRVGVDYAGEDAELPWRFLTTKEWCERVQGLKKGS